MKNPSEKWVPDNTQNLTCLRFGGEGGGFKFYKRDRGNSFKVSWYCSDSKRNIELKLKIDVNTF